MKRSPELGSGESEATPVGGDTCEKQGSLGAVGYQEGILWETMDEYFCEDFGREKG